ncbi:MAG: MBL fold metallo-hydrolase [Chthoniobacterales bacterium]|nr:MBL fold metallo-hydrolase [Chthoniobacterales bacterium]
MMTSLEDTWLDIVLKAIRGLNLDPLTLAQKSGIPQEKITSLLEGLRNDATLVAIAPALGLHPRELVMVAAETSHLLVPTLPKDFHCFTTLYHGMEVHSYLLWSQMNHHAVAFDTGADLTPLLEKLEQDHLSLKAIFLTHSHADHTLRLAELQKKQEVPAWIDPAELIDGTYPLTPDFSYQLDSRISIKALPTPGHSPGGTTYLIEGLFRPIAIVGDAIFARSVGGMPPASYAAGLKSIYNNILMLSPATLLAPGHGPLTTVEEERMKNPFFA